MYTAIQIAAKLPPTQASSPSLKMYNEDARGAVLTLPHPLLIISVDLRANFLKKDSKMKDVLLFWVVQGVLMVVGTHAENATVLFTDGMKDNQNRTWACVRGAAILQQGSTLLAFSGKKYFLFLQLHARLFQEGGQPIYIARNMHVLQSTSSNDLSTLYYPVSLFLFLFFPLLFLSLPPVPHPFLQSFTRRGHIVF